MKKRFKFPILLKVILAGLLVSFVASGVAIIVSYNNQVSTAKRGMIDGIDHSLDELAYYYEVDDNKDAAKEDLAEIKKHIKNYYDIRKSLGGDKKIEDFASFEEYEEYYQKADNWIFPVQGEMGLSQEMLSFRVKFRELIGSLLDAKLSSGMIAAYAAYRDVDNRIVFLCDSRMNSRLLETVDYYQLPGSFYELKDADVVTTKDGSSYSEYYIYGKTTRLYTVYNDDAKTDELALFFIEYDQSLVVKESTKVLRTEILILGLTSGAIVLIYALLSYFLFVKNVNKLSKASKEISHKLATKTLNEPTEIKIRSHDEMTNLAMSLDALQQAVFDYVNIIEREASEKQRMNAELEVASRIQLESLPPFSFDDSNISLRSYIKAAKEVGGDFYDYFYIDESRFGVVIADVSGKGIPASLFMMKSKDLLKSEILSSDSLEEAIYKANNKLVSHNSENLFVTAFVGIIDLKKKQMVFVNCGHEKPYILSKGKVNKLDGTSNFVIGEIEDFIYKQEQVKFNDGDILFMFTDGLNESVNHKNEEFGYARIEEMLAANQDKQLGEIIKSINESLLAFTGKKEAFDDVTMIALSSQSPRLSLKYRKKDYSLITEATDLFNDKYSYLPTKFKSEVGVILDELLNNYISYEKREDLEISIDFEIKNEKMFIIITTNGNDYNPFVNHKDKYIKSQDEEIELGGFGIKIVKDLVDSYKYEYKDNHSIITLTKKL